MLNNIPYTAKYTQPTSTNNFIPTHIYEIIIKDDGYTGLGYVITSTFDYTDNTEVDLYIRLSSEQSVKRYFKEIIEDERNEL